MCVEGHCVFCVVTVFPAAVPPDAGGAGCSVPATHVWERGEDPSSGAH